MGNPLEKVIDMLIGIIIIFIIPAFFFMMKQDVMTQIAVEKSNNSFVKNVAAQGYLTRDMYERYIDELGTTKRRYDVDLTHYQVIYEPEYILRTVDEVIEEDKYKWDGENQYHEMPVYTEPPDIYDPIDNTYNLNIETNKSVIDNTRDISVSPAHIHGDDCYIHNTRKYKVCDKMVTGIMSTHPNQTVYKNNPLITTVRAIYLDGSEKTVIAKSSFSTSKLVSNKSVILSYTSYIDETPITKTCNINVTVISKTNSCDNGHTYNLKSNGDDPGCPYCYGLLKSLSVDEPKGEKLVMYRNIQGTLQEEGVVLKAEYLDGHVEYVDSGYKDNLVPDYVGLQTATIGYEGFTATIDVEILKNLKRCDVCSLDYELNMDDTDPGCHYCRGNVPIFTGNVMEYQRESYKDEILNALYEGEEVYYFTRGDKFQVSTKSCKAYKGYTSLGKMLGLNIKANRTDTIKDEVMR